MVVLESSCISSSYNVHIKNMRLLEKTYKDADIKIEITPKQLIIIMSKIPTQTFQCRKLKVVKGPDNTTIQSDGLKLVFHPFDQSLGSIIGCIDSINDSTTTRSKGNDGRRSSNVSSVHSIKSKQLSSNSMDISSNKPSVVAYSHHSSNNSTSIRSTAEEVSKKRSVQSSSSTTKDKNNESRDRGKSFQSDRATIRTTKDSTSCSRDVRSEDVVPSLDDDTKDSTKVSTIPHRSTHNENLISNAYSSSSSSQYSPPARIKDGSQLSSIPDSSSSSSSSSHTVQPIGSLKTYGTKGIKRDHQSSSQLFHDDVFSAGSVPTTNYSSSSSSRYVPYKSVITDATPFQLLYNNPNSTNTTGSSSYRSVLHTSRSNAFTSPTLQQGDASSSSVAVSLYTSPYTSVDDDLYTSPLKKSTRYPLLAEKRNKELPMNTLPASLLVSKKPAFQSARTLFQSNNYPPCSSDTITPAVSSRLNFTTSRKKIQYLPGGIRNLGNTCYMSAVVQAVLAMSHLTTDMTSLFWRNIVDFQQPHNVSLSSISSITVPSSSSSSSSSSAPPSSSIHSAVHDSTLTGTTKESINKVYRNNSILFETIKIIDAASSVRCNSPPTENPQKVVEASSTHNNAVISIDCIVKEDASIVTSLPMTMAPKKDPIVSRGIRSAIDVAGLKKTLSYHCNKFNGYSQQDAHEFFTEWMSCLNEEMAGRLWDFCVKRSCDQPRHEEEEEEEDRTDGAAVCLRANGSPLNNDSSVLKTPSTRPAASESLTKSSSVVTHLSIRKHFSSTVSSGSISTTSGDTDGDGDANQFMSYSDIESIVPISSQLESIVEMTFSCNNCGYEREKKYELYQHFSFDLMTDCCDVRNQADECTHDEPHACLSNSSDSAAAAAAVASAITLSDLMNGFFRDEVRELKCESTLCTGSSAATTTAIEEENKVTISTRLVALPQILVIHMKRFKYDMSSLSYKKVSTPVEFPIIFDLESCREHIRVGTNCDRDVDQRQRMQWEVDPQEVVGDESMFQSFLEHMPVCIGDRDVTRSLKSPLHTNDDATTTHESSETLIPINIHYKLQAIVRHIGREAFAGHYVSDILSETSSVHGGTENVWKRYDDALVTVIDESEVLQDRSTPYMFFYKRC